MMQEIEKSQAIRLVDVFLIAPFLFFVALKYKMPALVKGILITIAVLTLLYNGENYLKNEYNRSSKG